MSLMERKVQLSEGPRAEKVMVSAGQLILNLAAGASLSIPARDLRPLKDLSDEQLSSVRLTAGGRVLLWPATGQSIDVAGLVEAVTGLRQSKYDPVATGALGGAARSESKRAAARENGKKGGRPPKAVAA